MAVGHLLGATTQAWGGGMQRVCTPLSNTAAVQFPAL